MTHTISNEFLSVTANEQGGSMTSIVYVPTGDERLWQGGKAWGSQDIAIFPTIGHAGEYIAKGRTYFPRSHGLARYSALTLRESTGNSMTLGFESSPETLKSYPYEFEYTVTYALEGNTLKVTFSARGKDEIIPFYAGGHPGMKVPGGRAEIEFENTENPVQYPLNRDDGTPLRGLKGFTADKAFFRKCRTYQLGSLSGGYVRMTTRDGYSYTYRSDCPLYAFWSNPDDGAFVCVEMWWGINDFPGAVKEITLKPFMNFAGPEGKSFSYSLTIDGPEK